MAVGENLDLLQTVSFRVISVLSMKCRHFRTRKGWMLHMVQLKLLSLFFIFSGPFYPSWSKSERASVTAPLFSYKPESEDKPAANCLPGFRPTGS